jgi:uncharacterized protein
MAVGKRIGRSAAFLVVVGLVAGLSPNTLAGPGALTPICAIQGKWFTSPYVGQNVTVQGIVTADLDQTSQKSIFLQSENCDNNPSTSDGIFVYLGERLQVVNSGDRVQVTGLVQEYYGFTEITATPLAVQVLSVGNPLPAAQELSPPFAHNDSRRYFESLESMYVSLGQGRAVGPTDADGRGWLVRVDLGIGRVFSDDPPGTGEIICVDDSGLFEIDPEVKVGDEVRGLAGVLDYRLGVYCLELTSAAQVFPSAQTATALPLTAVPTGIATFNLANLFDTVDDPAVDDDVLSPTEYQRRLQKRALAIHDTLGEPALLAVQEVENNTVLQALLDRPEIQASYSFVWINGPDRRGMDVALLYRRDRATVYSFQARQGCTTLVDGLGPDGNDDVLNPQNALTCDRNSDGILDGNRLFSRPPLVVHLAAGGGQSSAPAAATDWWLVLLHLKSKVEDTITIPYTLPRRVEQASFTAALVQEIHAAYPASALIVLGDLNDLPGSQPLATLAAAGLADAWQAAPAASRYSYIYQGISQAMDYVLWYPQPDLMLWSIAPAPINADYPYEYNGKTDSLHRCSDHDPLRVDFAPPRARIFLPLMRK